MKNQVRTIFFAVTFEELLKTIELLLHKSTDKLFLYNIYFHVLVHGVSAFPWLFNVTRNIKQVDKL